MMDKGQLKELIEETLKEVDLYNENAVYLILGTAAQESGFGKYIKQLGNGPALGIFQMEPNTFNDIIENWLKYKNDLYHEILLTLGHNNMLDPDVMRWNLKAAIIMTRLHYRRVKAPLPTDLNGYAEYWKKYYNTYLGAGTVEEFIHNYKKYVL